MSPAATARAEGGSLTGTLPLLRTSLRHDGRKFAPWVAIATVLSASSVLVYPWVFHTQQARQGLAAAVGANPALGLIFGPAFDVTTADGFNAWRALALGGFLAALGAISTVMRATRGQEDSGQAELLASGVLGRSSRLLTGVAMALTGSLALGLVSALLTVACGGGWGPSMLLGATFTATGWMFTGVAAIAAQLGSDAHTASSIAVATLGTLFVLRGFAYAVEAPAWAVWANPLGWMTETRPATGDHWWPLLLAGALTLVALVAAFILQARRDFGQGAIKPAPGPSRGRARTAWGLTLRLNRGLLIAWTIAFALLGIVFGYLAASITDVLGPDSPAGQILAAGATGQSHLISAFLLTLLSLLGIIAAVPGVQTMLKVRSEEMEDRVEPVMATAVTRSRYYVGNVLLALGAPTIYLLIAGTLVAALASGSDIGVTFSDVLLQALATVPAVWTVVAVSAAVIGARPAVSLAAWIGVVASFGLTLLGPTFGLDDWVLGISPFWHVPEVTATAVDLTGLLWITLFTTGFLLIGFAGFRRRDLAR
ncbi:multidrug ABC transporter permease [Georgenia wutianyii]|uniref:Multidrug ABC transporter permease n=1 Tax=Georgenia wutianyii TaxID=2585135 RepID=A0ABX5VPM2_9MICO|nr:multidrug ABC transporter permease [Georgenia wutianyii]QDB78740.1 multidrug ABC transporter permease [Georgenia wutianyii]